MEVYPPDREVVSGREGVEKALMSTLVNDHMQEHIERDAIVHDGPPSVILRNNLQQCDRTGLLNNTTLGRIESTGQDDESEITTEIEDLQLKEETNDDNWTNLDTTGKQLAYEQGDGDSCQELAREEYQRPNNNHAEPEPDDVFHESILQFHRRLNEVLAETRSESKLREAIEKRHFREEKKTKIKTPLVVNKSAHVAKQENVTTRYTELINLLVTKRWKILIIAATGTLATMIMVWFALGCYGFYVLFLGGAKAPHMNSRSTTLSFSPPTYDASMQQPPSVIIQVVVGQKLALDETRNIGLNSDKLASMSLDEWKQMTRDVEAAIRQQVDSGNEL
jgi:hypothetical protein